MSDVDTPAAAANGAGELLGQGSQVRLTRVLSDHPAAVLLVDMDACMVVYANRLAAELAPDVTLPALMQDWSQAAGPPVVQGGLDHTGPLTEIAVTHGVTVGQVALAWLFAVSDRVLPIPGTSRRDHLEQNLAAAQVTLSNHELERLTAMNRPASEAPPATARTTVDLPASPDGMR